MDEAETKCSGLTSAFPNRHDGAEAPCKTPLALGLTPLALFDIGAKRAGLAKGFVCPIFSATIRAELQPIA
jgi:hypothetical protein